jgi:heat shock protein HslJ
MKKIIKFFLLASGIVLLFSACASGASVKTSTAGFQDIQQKTWALVEIRISGEDTLFIDRKKLNEAGNGDAYTLVINEERISGKANPNRYFTSYELGEDPELFLSVVAGTLMWGIVEPGMLLEQDYYTYLQSVNSWDLNGGALELATVTQEDLEAILVFIPVEEGDEG